MESSQRREKTIDEYFVPQRWSLAESIFFCLNKWTTWMKHLGMKQRRHNLTVFQRSEKESSSFITERLRLSLAFRKIRSQRKEEFNLE